VAASEIKIREWTMVEGFVRHTVVTNAFAMARRAVACAVSLVFSLPLAGAAWAGTEGLYSTFYGQYTGAPDDSLLNTFVGTAAGHSTTSGSSNTFVGRNAGLWNTGGYSNVYMGNDAGENGTVGHGNVYVGVGAGQDGNGVYNSSFGFQAGATSGGAQNVYVGDFAGYTNTTGNFNVFIGNQAGYDETGSSKLYVDNCDGGDCSKPPLIYGEFDNHLLKINGVTHVAANGVAKSQMHFSLDNGDYGGFLTSVLPNNFFVSSGARYDSGNWVQRSSDGNAVMAGSGGAGYRIFTHTGTPAGSTFNNPTLRLHIDYSGQFGINTTPVAGDEIHTSSGAHLTSGGVWTDASSREYKENIQRLTSEEAQQTLAALDPVRYNYKTNPHEKHVGFIAEDVPELVAREDRKSLSPMDIVAVLTKVVQEQDKVLEEKSRIVDDQKAVIARQQSMLESIEARLATLEIQAARK
jgi:hypothetical protein